MSNQHNSKGAPDRGGRAGELRINELIIAHQVRLIDAAGEMIGVVSCADALHKAQEQGLDLVEVSPQESPPVCKILDYGRLKYEAQKKRTEAKKKQKVIDIKEIQLRPRIEEHDYQVKLRSAIHFLQDGNKIKVTLQFRGREMSHQEFGIKLLEKLQTDLAELAKIESFPRLEGKRMMMILGPK